MHAPHVSVLHRSVPPRAAGPGERPHPRGQQADPDGGEAAHHIAAVMFPTSSADKASLLATFGEQWDLEDGRRVEHPSLVVLRPSSPQTVEAVRAQFPAARVVVVELPLSHDSDSGPVLRALGAGADEYVVCQEPAMRIAC
jgi:hypothetical protein